MDKTEELGKELEKIYWGSSEEDMRKYGYLRLSCHVQALVLDAQYAEVNAIPFHGEYERKRLSEITRQRQEWNYL